MKYDKELFDRRARQFKKLEDQKYEDCVVCKGTIKAIIRQDHNGVIGSPASAPYINGYYCSQCGIRYHQVNRIDE